MNRHRSRRNSAAAKLNLVALMDIFTILVFFLMVNSSDVQIKETHESVKLPKSVTKTMPADVLKLYITADYMFFDGEPVRIPLSSFAPDQGIYPALVTRLEAIAAQQGPIPPEREQTGRPIVLLGDFSVDYNTIQRILASCAKTSFRDVSLAVVQEDPPQIETSGVTRPAASAALAQN